MPPLAHPNRRFAAAGLTIPRVIPLSQPVSDTLPKPPQESQGVIPGLIDILPPFVVKPAYFAEVQIPANTNFGATANALSACYCVESFKVPDDFGEQVGLIGYHLEMLPSDSAGGLTTTGGGAGSSTGWGATDGTKSALLVVLNSGLARQTWGPLPIYYPSVETGANNLGNPQASPEYPLVHSWPTGKYNDTTPNRLNLPRSFLPTLKPLPDGTRVDVIWAVRRSQVAADAAGTMMSGAAIKYLLGHAYLQLVFAKTIRSVFWRR